MADITTRETLKDTAGISIVQDGGKIESAKHQKRKKSGIYFDGFFQDDQSTRQITLENGNTMLTSFVSLVRNMDNFLDIKTEFDKKRKELEQEIFKEYTNEKSGVLIFLSKSKTGGTNIVSPILLGDYNPKQRPIKIKIFYIDGSILEFSYPKAEVKFIPNNKKVKEKKFENIEAFQQDIKYKKYNNIEIPHFEELIKINLKKQSEIVVPSSNHPKLTAEALRPFRKKEPLRELLQEEEEGEDESEKQLKQPNIRPEDEGLNRNDGISSKSSNCWTERTCRRSSTSSRGDSSSDCSSSGDDDCCSIGSDGGDSN